jgi:hypothetical protein
MKYIAALLVITSPLCSFSQTSEIARKNYSETVKNYCINYWTTEEGNKHLSKFATISEQCKCVQDETSYFLTDDFANRVLEMQLQANNSAHKFMSEDAANAIISEIISKFSSANRACGEKFIRRRQSTR